MITGNSCYWFSNTSYPTQLLTWNDAKAKCVSFRPPPGATGTVHLVTLDTQIDAVCLILKTYIKTSMRKTQLVISFLKIK